MKKILILYGGNSFEHEISCMSAQNVCKCLKKDEFDKVYISNENNWYLIKDNEKIELTNIIKFLKNYKIVFPVMHGAFGEDGRLQSLFELFNINYVGSNSVSSMISMNKFLTKLIAEKNNIKQVPYFILNKKDEIKEMLEYPVIVKPVNGGSSIGINVAHSFKELKKAIKNAFKYDDSVIVEKFVKGLELECGIVKLGKIIIGDIGEIKHSHEFYDFEAKYQEKTKIVIPANIDDCLKRKIEKETRKIFEMLSLQDFARVDFIYDNQNDILYFNEVNTIPGFTDSSMFPLMFKDKKLDFPKLIRKLLKKVNKC